MIVNIESMNEFNKENQEKPCSWKVWVNLNIIKENINTKKAKKLYIKGNH
jgi:hypothetical protein